MADRVHIMVLSAGSLLGQNILDAVEGRRARVRVTGVDASPDSPRLYRCDKAVLSPTLESREFDAFLRQLISTQRPTVVLPGRDQDVLRLATMRESDPDLAGVIPCGPRAVADILNDKALSHAFALSHGLPFVPSLCADEVTAAHLAKWVAQHGFPLLAKPRTGSGSLGIRILANQGHLDSLLMREESGLVLQPMLHLSDQRRKYIEALTDGLACGIPLFAHVPDDDQYAGQALIGPDGVVIQVFTSLSRMVIGRCEAAEACQHPVLVSTVRGYAEAIAAAGWRGMFNVQLRRHGDAFMAHEMNGRMSGSTSARRWLGFDEVRELLRAFYGLDIGPDERGVPATPGAVIRSLTDQFVAQRDRDELARTGVWERRA